jgi:hypothetical protein
MPKLKENDKKQQILTQKKHDPPKKHLNLDKQLNKKGCKAL